ncbi:MAG: hypothetical protein IJH04_08420 [Eggerthellaceae bacterium]|nr:hypothetical protein [Eggerthellaceae bacterium]
MIVPEGGCAESGATDRAQALENLRQDLYDLSFVGTMGGCGAQLVVSNAVMGADEKQLIAMAHENGLLLSSYGLSE